MDKIYMNGLEFYGYHGVFPEENRLGQRYYADVEMYCSLKEAGLTDDLDKTVNYAEAYEVIKRIMDGEPVQLVETLAERIATDLLENFEILRKVQVKVTKPMPPIAGVLKGGVAVEIVRER